MPISHPRLGWVEALGLWWYAIPAVSSIELSLGGLSYPASPFNGWYQVTEIATRNFGDRSRYNLLPLVAAHLDLDPRQDASCWQVRRAM